MEHVKRLFVKVYKPNKRRNGRFKLSRVDKCLLIDIAYGVEDKTITNNKTGVGAEIRIFSLEIYTSSGSRLGWK